MRSRGRGRGRASGSVRVRAGARVVLSALSLPARDDELPARLDGDARELRGRGRDEGLEVAVAHRVEGAHLVRVRGRVRVRARLRLRLRVRVRVRVRVRG